MRRFQHDEITVTDLFCGAGGSSSGLKQLDGVTVRQAANHWRTAVDTHNANHPEADHDCADISQVDPRRYPRTTLLWASPECTNHSGAKGVKRTAQLDLFSDRVDEAAERSRATMWDVARFAEFHRYAGFIVENVVEATKWVGWRGWRLTLEDMGYCLHTVFLNSAFASQLGAPAPQSRDRLYVVGHLKASKCPDLDRWTRPQAWCPTCDQSVQAIQAWKKTTPGGKYRAQYVWRCPNVSCRNAEVDPYVLPAAAVIDWSNPGTRIGDRDKPLAAKTMARIEAGLAKYGHLVASGGLAVPVEGRDGKAAAPTTAPLRTLTSRAETALAVPPFIAELRGGGSTHRPVSQPLATVTASGNHHGLVIPSGGTWNTTSEPTTWPLRTMTTREAYALCVPYYGNGTAQPATSPIGTLTTRDRYGLIMRNNGGGAEMTTPIGEPIRTLTTGGHQSLLTGDIATILDVNDCFFRMLTTDEIRAAMTFEAAYIFASTTKRDIVRMLGNAVTPCSARDLGAALIESLGHEVALAA